MDLHCPKCGSDQAVKNGKMSGKQRYRCKNCGYQYTTKQSRGYDEEKKIALMLYVAGLSIRKIAVIVGVSAQSVSRWTRKYLLSSGQPAVYVREFEEINIPADVPASPKNALSGKAFLVPTVLKSGTEVHLIIKVPDKIIDKVT